MFPPRPPMGPQGGMMQPPGGTMPYKENAFSSFVQGVGSFVGNYRAGREAEKQKAQDEFEKGIQAMMLGLPIDEKKLAQAAKKAGLNVKLDGPTDAEIHNKQQQAASQEAQLSLMAQPPIGMAGLAGAGPQIAASQPVAGLPPQQAPGMMQKLGSALGFGSPQVSSQSPMMQWIRQMQAKGKSAQETQQLDAQLKTDILKTSLAAMKGDPAALEMATRSGLFKALPKEDTILWAHRAGLSPEHVAKTLLWAEAGGPQMAMKMRELAKDFAPRFGGDLAAASKYVTDIYDTGRSDLRPGSSIEELKEQNELRKTLAANSPTAPVNLLEVAVMAAHTPGGKDIWQAALSELSKYPRGETVDIEKFLKTEGRLERSMKQELSIHSANYGLSKMKVLMDAAGDQGKLWWDILQDKNASLETKNDAVKGFAASINAKGGLTHTLSGGTVDAAKVTTEDVDRWLGLATGKTELRLSKADLAKIEALAGKPEKAAELSGLLRKLAEKSSQNVAGQDWLELSSGIYDGWWNFTKPIPRSGRTQNEMLNLLTPPTR